MNGKNLSRIDAGVIEHAMVKDWLFVCPTCCGRLIFSVEAVKKSFPDTSETAEDWFKFFDNRGIEPGYRWEGEWMCWDCYNGEDDEEYFEEDWQEGDR